MVKASDSKSDGVTRVGSNPAAVEFFIVRYSNDKYFAKNDNKGISLIKKFIRIMYMKIGEAIKNAAK